MRFTVLEQFIAVALLGSTSGILFAQSPPRILRDPLLELGYEQAKARFKPLPLQALAGCATLSDNEYSVGVHFVFARTGDTAGRLFICFMDTKSRTTTSLLTSPSIRLAAVD